MSQAQPMVSGKRIILPCYRKQVTLATFTDHHTAVYVLAKFLYPVSVRDIPLSKSDTDAANGLQPALIKARQEN